MADSASRGPAVAQKEDLLRAILYPEWWDAQERKVSSAAYGFPKFSADMESLTTIDAALAAFDPGSGLVRFNSGVARDLGFDVRHEPENGNEAHCHVYCDFGSNQRKKRARKLADESVIVIEPDLDLLRNATFTGKKSE